MKKQEYRSILGHLPIKSPAPEDMAKLCPHLTPQEALAAFTEGDGYVACPSLRVKNAFQIVSLSKEWVETIEVSRIKGGTKDASVRGTKNHPARLDWSYAGRTPKSYADGKAHGDVFHHYLHMDKAIQFSDANWGNELILDNWVSVLQIYLQDPTDLVNDKYHTDYPRTKAVLGVALNRDLNEIINDHSKPESMLFDEAITELTIDQVVWHELKGGRGGFTDFNCAHCGAGLGLNCCTGCGHRFRDDQMRCGWSTPLSPKMVAFLCENGFQFKIDPKIAQEKELQRFKSKI